MSRLARVPGGGMWELSVLSVQFCCESKIALKKKIWNQIVVMIAWLCECPKTHRVIHYKRVIFMAYPLYPSKAVMKKKRYPLHKIVQIKEVREGELLSTCFLVHESLN